MLGDFEEAGLVAHGAGESTAHVPEEFGLQQRFGQRGAVDGHERPAGARALIVDHPHDEFLAGAALSVDQDRRVQRRDPRRELEHILHGRAAGDELLGRGVASDALAQQVQLALTFGHQPLAAVHVLQPPVHNVAKTLDFPPKTAALKIGAKGFQLDRPSSPRPSQRRCTVAAPCARHSLFAEVDFLSQARAGVAAGVTHERPADRRAAFAVVVHVLLGHVRVVPQHFLLKPAGVASCSSAAISARTIPSSLCKTMPARSPSRRIRPVRAVAQAHGVVVPVRIPKPQEQAPRRLEAQACR